MQCHTRWEAHRERSDCDDAGRCRDEWKLHCAQNRGRRSSEEPPDRWAGAQELSRWERFRLLGGLWNLSVGRRHPRLVRGCSPREFQAEAG